MAEGSVVMGYEVATLGNPIAMFRENIAASYPEVQISKNNSPHWILKCVVTTYNNNNNNNNKLVPYYQ